jgi:hypothetical protein
MNLMSQDDIVLIEDITKYLYKKNVGNYDYDKFPEIVNGYISQQKSEVAISKYDEYHKNIYELTYIAYVLKCRRDRRR